MGKGILGKHELSKHNINFRETATFYEGRLKIDRECESVEPAREKSSCSGRILYEPISWSVSFPREWI